MVIIFIFIFTGPEIFDVFTTIKSGGEVEKGSLIFLAIAGVFFFFVFRILLNPKKSGVAETSLSHKKINELIKFGNKTKSRFLELDVDVIETSDPRAVYLVLQETKGLKKYKALVFKNSENLVDELKDTEFNVYCDPENPYVYYVNLQEIINKKGHIFFIPM